MESIQASAQPALTPHKTKSLLQRQRTPLLATAVLLLLLGSMLYLRWVSPVSVRAHRVTSGEVVAEVFGRGTVESEREAQLGFDLVGRLSEVLVEEGERVSLGQALARLYPEQVRADLRVATSGVSPHALRSYVWQPRNVAHAQRWTAPRVRSGAQRT